MFPVSLTFYLAADIDRINTESLHNLVPDMDWGKEEDLLKHSDHWPEAVVTLRCQPNEPERPCMFPVEANFVWFPGRVTGNDLEMNGIKLALLQKLAKTFECRVLTGATELTPGESDEIQFTHRSESLICQSGRIFSGMISHYEAREGQKPRGGWVPLDTLPTIELGTDGKLLDETNAKASLHDWLCSRDISHLREENLFPFDSPEFPSDDEGANEQFGDEEDSQTDAPSEEREHSDNPQDGFESIHSGNVDEYLARLEAWENGAETTMSKQLISQGTSLPPAEDLSDDELHEKLKEIIANMRKSNNYLYNTDHLSDRELYTYLWEEGLNEGIMDLSGLSGAGSHLDVLGSGDEASKEILLTYYDDAIERAEWKSSYPNDTIPAHQEKPFDRDRHLPSPDY